MKVQSLADITVVILAGGQGTRLRSVVDDRPKALAQINNRPFLIYLLDQVVTLGMRHAVLCTGYMGVQLASTFGDSYGPLQLTYSQESQPLGTAGAIRQALSLVQSNPMLVMNGDSYCQADVEGFLRWHGDVGAKASLYLIKVPDIRRYGQVHLDGQNRIARFEEKGQTSGSGWISAGMYLLSKEFVAGIPEGRAVSIERETFPSWIGSEFYGFRGEGRFIDIGTPESYALAEEFFSRAVPNLKEPVD